MNKIKLTQIYLSRLTALSLVITCLTISAFAQDDGATTNGFRAGLKVGANFNQFNQPGTTIGFNGGLFAAYSPIKVLELQLEVLYMQQGGAREAYFQDLTYLDGTVTGINYFNRYVTFHNVEVPVIVRATLPSLSGESITPRLLVGFAYGFAVGAMEYSDKHYYFAEDGLVVPVSNQRTNVGANYEQHQFGVIAGFAVDYSLGGKIFTTEVRYRRGINELNLLNYAVLEHSGQLYSSSLSINFAMSLFNL